MEEILMIICLICGVTGWFMYFAHVKSFESCQEQLDMYIRLYHMANDNYLRKIRDCNILRGENKTLSEELDKYRDKLGDSNE